MATDFAVCLRHFLTTHLAGLRGCSPSTVGSYRDTFKLLIAYFRDERSIPPGKLTLDCIDAAAITGFLEWLEASRHNSASTRNQRLAAISSFCTWMQTCDLQTVGQGTFGLVAVVRRIPLRRRVCRVRILLGWDTWA